MYLSELVVLDLRGFARHREGTGYGIGLLAEGGLPSCAVAVRDAATSGSEVEPLVREADVDPCQLTWVAEDARGDALLERLLAVAGRGREQAARGIAPGPSVRDLQGALTASGRS
jgi:hypothetical protein